jgi:anti-sigma B factor antagonist
MTAQTTTRGLTVRKSVLDSVAVITLSGDLDAHSATVVHADVMTIMPAHSEVLLDLSDVTHVTSAGLRTLLLLYRQGQCLDSAIALVGLSPDLRGVLSASGFLDFFRVVDSVADGVEVLGREAAQRESGQRERVDA